MRYINVFVIGVMLFTVGTSLAQDEFPKKHGLPVNNYSESLTWSEFQETFLAVDSTNPLDVLLFNKIKDMPQDGYCFGMVLLAGAVYVEGGYMGLCEPLGSYAVSDSAPSSRDTLTPFWPIFKHDYHVLWGRQFAQPMVLQVVELISSGDFQNAVLTYNKVESYLSGNEIPIVLISESLAVSGTSVQLAGMHAVLPYKLEKDGTTWKMYVYDPSRPYIVNPDFYRNHQNVITINSTFGTSWSYLGPNNHTWSGFIYTFPGIRLLLPSTNPLLISNLSETVGKLIVNGGKIVAFDRTDNDAMLFPFDFFSSNSNRHFYILANASDEKYKLKVESKGEYEILVAGNGGVFNIHAQNVPKEDIIEIKGLKSGDIEVSLSPNAGNAEYAIDVHNVISPEHIQTYRVKSGVLTETQKMIVGLSQEGELLVSTSIPQEIGIAYSEYVNGKTSNLDPAHLILTPDNVFAFKPSQSNNSLVAEVKTGRFKLWAEK